MRNYTSILLAAGLVVALGAAKTAPKTADDPTTEDQRREIRKALLDYAEKLKSPDVEAVVASFSWDGELMEPDLPTLSGKKAILDFLTPLAAENTVASAALDALSIRVFGKIAYVFGTYLEEAGPKGGATKVYSGRFAAELWRDDEGQWYFRRLMMQPGPKPRNP